ncbi:Metallo-dependent phosphatase-like protein [Xylariaceae sp. FL0255]|nr:Metallo-dependent phosphatase-like protein [Xylariaceae sp. FL0255]
MSDPFDLAVFFLEELNSLGEHQDIQVEPVILPFIHQLITHATELFNQEHNLVTIQIPLRSKLVLVGDLHGQWRNLREIVKTEGEPLSSNKYIFNGDFGGRGPQSLETFLALASYKIKYPEAIFLTRGNHESDGIASEDGCRQEIQSRLGVDTLAIFSSFFKVLPLAAVVKGTQSTATLLIVHGCVPVADTGTVTLEQIAELERRIEPPEGAANLVTQKLWNDPCAEHGTHPSEHGGWGKRVGPDETAKFLSLNKLTGIFRSHVEIHSVQEDYSGCTTGKAMLPDSDTLRTINSHSLLCSSGPCVMVNIQRNAYLPDWNYPIC